MSAFSPTTLADASAIVAAKLNKQLPLARREVVTMVNRARQRIFDFLQPHSAFNDVWLRIRPGSYRDQPGTYLGFTLPRHVDALGAAWRCSQHVRIQSEWREVYDGLPPSGRPCNAVVGAGHVPTERSLLRASTLQVFSEGATGSVVIRGFDRSNGRLVAELPLSKNQWTASTKEFYSIESVVLPSGMASRVILADSIGYELAHYMPGETVPSYARFRCGSANSYIIKGTRKFVEVSCDSDVVEVGDRRVLEAAATGLRYESSTNPTEKRTSITAFADMEKALADMLTRVRGGEQRGPVLLRRKKVSLYRPRHR